MNKTDGKNWSRAAGVRVVKTIRNGNSAANFNTLAHIAAQAVACTAVQSNLHYFCRSVKTFCRTA